MVRVTLVGQLAAMNEAGDARGAGYIAGQLTKTLETIARVTGEIGDLAHSVTINNTNVAVVKPWSKGVYIGRIRTTCETCAVLIVATANPAATAATMTAAANTRCRRKSSATTNRATVVAETTQTTGS